MALGAYENISDRQVRCTYGKQVHIGLEVSERGRTFIRLLSECPRAWRMSSNQLRAPGERCGRLDSDR
jgi:hypothetical protein